MKVDDRLAVIAGPLGIFQRHIGAIPGGRRYNLRHPLDAALEDICSLLGGAHSEADSGILISAKDDVVFGSGITPYNLAFVVKAQRPEVQLQTVSNKPKCKDGKNRSLLD